MVNTWHINEAAWSEGLDDVGLSSSFVPNNLCGCEQIA